MVLCLFSAFIHSHQCKATCVATAAQYGADLQKRCSQSALNVPHTTTKYSLTFTLGKVGEVSCPGTHQQTKLE